MQLTTCKMQQTTQRTARLYAARGDTAIAANALRLQHAPMNHAACTRQRSRQTARNMQQRWFHLKRRSTASRLHAHRFGLAGRWVDLIRIDLHSGTHLACNVQLAHTWRTTYSWHTPGMQRTAGTHLAYNVQLAHTWRTTYSWHTPGVQRTAGTQLAYNILLAHTWRTTYSWSIVYTAHRCAARPRSHRRHAALNGAGCIPPTSAPGLGPCCNIYTGCTVSR